MQCPQGLLSLLISFYNFLLTITHIHSILFHPSHPPRYLSKIKDEPLISRYRKISATNKNFTSLVQPLRNHEQVLEALGFQRKGQFFHYDDTCIGSCVTSSETSDVASIGEETLDDRGLTKEEGGVGSSLVDASVGSGLASGLESVLTADTESAGSVQAAAEESLSQSFLTRAIEILSATKTSANFK